MAELSVVDDTNIECAVLIDTDTWTALPIVAMGENRTNLLQAFVDSVPFDVTLLKDEMLMEGWRQFLTAQGAIPQSAADTPTDDQMGTQPRNGSDAESALAATEAANATDVPAEQPADTDQESTPSTRQVESDCFNCNGRGTIEFGDGQPAVRCNVCKGTGRIVQEVPA